MISTLFWLVLIATGVLAAMSYRSWQAYHAGRASRVQLVNTVALTAAGGAATVGLMVLGAFVR